jgi:hypothetical protein
VAIQKQLSLLIDKGASVQLSRLMTGELTTLHYAAQSGNPEIVALLSPEGAIC